MAVAVATVVAGIGLGLAGSSANAAKGLCKDGTPPPCKPGGTGVETSNNLSVPTVFIGSVGFGLEAPGGFGVATDLVYPTGTPSTGYDGVDPPIDSTAYYYVQGEHVWQAQYEVLETDTVTAKWGDNLAGGEASVKAGHPVRVEVGLTSATVTDLDGFSVVKLQNLDDRYSAYGTEATAADPLVLATDLTGADETAVVVTTTIPADTPEPGMIEIGTDSGGSQFVSYTSWTGSTFTIPETDFSGDNATAGNDVSVYQATAVPAAQTPAEGVRVWVAGATLDIAGPAGLVTTVAMPGEINATGAPVFGFNWKPVAAGDYTLTFHAPATVTFSPVGDPTIPVTVTAGGSGGDHGKP